MPRISPQVIRNAFSVEPLLARLLPVCRTLTSARNELRWLQEHAKQSLLHSQAQNDHALSALVERRALGEPLQYILGSEYFGDLEITCKPGVLIPRQETAASVSHLVQSLKTLLPQTSADKPLRMLDLCTGTGCIPLLFHHEFYAQAERRRQRLDLVGIDICDRALMLSEQNRQRQILQKSSARRSTPEAESALSRLRFIKADMLAAGKGTPSLTHILEQLPPEQREFQILISNPPYISAHEHKTITAPSVRRYEPQLALVPPSGANMMGIADGDQFYPRLWDTADMVNAEVVLFEVGSPQQAIRVADMGCKHHEWQHIEIWKDNPTGVLSTQEEKTVKGDYNVIGNGNARSVVARRSDT